MESLSEAREAIERIDRELVRLLAERLEAIREVGRHKAAHGGIPLRDRERERELFAAWADAGKAHGLSPYFLGRILREVLAWSRRDQERELRGEAPVERTATARVAFQGAPDAYSDLAAHKLFGARGESVRTVGQRTFAGCLDALEAGEVDFALLPVENTIAGSIDEVYRLLGARHVHVVDEEVWRVEHRLAGVPGARPEQLRTVRSHPVALLQCERFLSSLVGVTAETAFDTAAAAAEVAAAGDPTVAAICSDEAAERAGLEVLADEVADTRHNHTRFLLVASEPRPLDPRVPARTSLVLTLAHREGALAEVLATFARAGVNLTKLESRPQPESPWEYLFYIDVEGHAEREPLASALRETQPHVHHLRVLGSYPRRAGAEEAHPDREPRAAQALEPEPVARGVPETPAAAAPAAKGAGGRVGLTDGGERTRIRVGNVEIGPDTFTLIAGPCAVENRSQMMDAAEMVRAHGAVMLRGGAFKPRSSPYAFQGLGVEGLELLAEAGAAFELPVVTEVLRAEDVAKVAEFADVLQIGARNMQNTALLRELGSVRKPVLLKRGLSATIEELLLAAEYVLDAGNHRVILCERGIRTFETATRSTLDVSAVPVLKERSHLPVIVDPSHAAGRRALVIPLALAAVAAGADGLIVEAHPRPAEALCDKDQALVAEDLAELARRLAPLTAGRG